MWCGAAFGLQSSSSSFIGVSDAVEEAALDAVVLVVVAVVVDVSELPDEALLSAVNAGGLDELGKSAVVVDVSSSVAASFNAAAAVVERVAIGLLACVVCLRSFHSSSSSSMNVQA